MSEPDKTGSEESASAPKPKFDLRALSPKKAAVGTSIGTLFVGAHGFPAAVVAIKKDEDAGLSLVRHVCNRIEDKHEISQLELDDANRLSDQDIAQLGPVIAKQQRWELDQEFGSAAEIGQAARHAFERRNSVARAELEKIHKSMASGFSFLKGPTLQRLQDDMTDLVALRNLAVSPDASILGKAASAGLGRTTSGIMSAIDMMRRGSTLSSVPNPAAVIHGIEAIPLHHDPVIAMPTFPAPEDSVLGQATLKSADNSEQAVGLMREMTVGMSKVQETLVVKVLPEWIAHIERQQASAAATARAADENTRSAAKNLGLTVVGIFLSIVVTGLTTLWQVNVANGIDKGNTAQLARAEELLQSQLAEQKEALKVQREEAAALRELLQQGTRKADQKPPPKVQDRPKTQ